LSTGGILHHDFFNSVDIILGMDFFHAYGFNTLKGTPLGWHFEKSEPKKIGKPKKEVLHF